MSRFFAIPPHPRGTLRLAGEDRVTFLQGLISNDVRLVAPDRGIWAALLTPQGRYLHDFFVVEQGDHFLIDADGERLSDLLRRLKLYKLRAKITLQAVPESGTLICWGEEALTTLSLTTAGATKPIAGGVAMVDPRDPALGFRAIGLLDTLRDGLRELGFVPGDLAQWQRLRISAGIPDGTMDLVPEKSLLLENGFDELGGVAWDKGCYIGQELTARTKYRGLVKKRLVPFTFEGPEPATDSVITLAGEEVGEIRSVADGMGLALLRLDALAKDQVLNVGDTSVRGVKPDWLKLDLRPASMQ